ncbi:MAG TPA: TIM barrel protein [Chloroflexota bacterium]|nr:TIM barrel protein [Chloroflexota bacterium]
MKISLRESAFRRSPAELTLEKSFAELARMGYDGVELSTNPDREARGVRQRRGVWPGTLDQARRAQLKAAAAANGLEIPTLSSDWAWGYADFHPTLGGWGRGTELLVDDAKLAADVGAGSILIHFGTSTGTWDQAKGILKEAAGESERLGVVLGFEGSIWFRVGLGGQETLVRMVDEIASPALKIYVHPHGDTAAQVRDIEQVGDRICALHASALNPDVDYGQVFAALKRAGYDWYWCFEVAEDLFAASASGFKELARKPRVSLQ